MNPCAGINPFSIATQVISSAFGVVGSALQSPPQSAESGIGGGNENNIANGSLSSGNSGIGTGTILTLAVVGIGGFFLIKHFIK